MPTSIMACAGHALSDTAIANYKRHCGHICMLAVTQFSNVVAGTSMHGTLCYGNDLIACNMSLLGQHEETEPL